MRKSLAKRIDQLEHNAAHSEAAARRRNAPPLTAEQSDQMLMVFERLAFMDALDMGLAKDDAGNLRIPADGRFIASPGEWEALIRAGFDIRLAEWEGPIEAELNPSIAKTSAWLVASGQRLKRELADRRASQTTSPKQGIREL